MLSVGLIATWLGSGWASKPRAGLFAIMMGLAWAGALSAMAYAVSALSVPVAVIAPLTNSHALVAVLASCIVFGERAQLNGPRLVVGAAFIVPAAFVVSTAKT